jgi:hypothetical protein
MLLSSIFSPPGITCYLRPVILRKRCSTNICNCIWVVTFHVSHPYTSSDLTFLLYVRIKFSSVYFYSSAMGTILAIHKAYRQNHIKDTQTVSLRNRSFQHRNDTRKYTNLCVCGPNRMYVLVIIGMMLTFRYDLIR